MCVMGHFGNSTMNIRKKKKKVIKKFSARLYLMYFTAEQENSTEYMLTAFAIKISFFMQNISFNFALVITCV